MWYVMRVQLLLLNIITVSSCLQRFSPQHWMLKYQPRMIHFSWSVTHWKEPQKQFHSNVRRCRSWWFYITTRLSNSLLSNKSPQYVLFAYRDKSLSFTSHICMIICALPQHHAVIHMFDIGYYPLQADTSTETREGQQNNSMLLSWKLIHFAHQISKTLLNY